MHMQSELLENNISISQPKSLPILFFAELCERFSHYGLRALLIFYMVSELKYSDSRSYGIYGMYFTLVYASSIVGGYLADNYLGNRKAVVIGGFIIIIGHICLALPIEQLFVWGLSFIIIGTGFFKANITSLLGQYYQLNDPRRDGGFTIFYMGANLGSFIAPFVCSYLGRKYGWHYGFGIAGLGMLLGISVLFLGKKSLGNIGLSPNENKLNQKIFLGLSFYQWIIVSILLSVPVFSWGIQNYHLMENVLYALGIIISTTLIFIAIRCEKEERKAMLTLISMLPFFMTFWISIEQAGSSISLFTERHVDRVVLGYQTESIWYQACNPFFIITLAPLFSALWIYLGKRKLEPTTPTKFSLGLFQAGLSFLFLKIGIEESLANGTVAVIWLLLAHLFQATGELCISPVGLSMVTKLSPKRFASFMMGALFLSIAFAAFIAQKIAQFFFAGQGTGIMSSLDTFKNTFQFLIYLPMIAGTLIFLLSPFYKKIFRNYQ